MIQKVSVSYLYVEPQSMGHRFTISPFFVFNLVQGQNGKVIFAERNHEGVFTLISSITKEHIQCVGGLIDFEHVDYTLFVQDILTKIDESHSNYELELMVDTLVSLLTEVNNADKEREEFLSLLMKHKVVHVFPTLVSLDVFRRKKLVQQIKNSFPNATKGIGTEDLLLLINKTTTQNGILKHDNRDLNYYSCIKPNSKSTYRLSLITSDYILNVA